CLRGRRVGNVRIAGEPGHGRAGRARGSGHGLALSAGAGTRGKDGQSSGTPPPGAVGAVSGTVQEGGPQERPTTGRGGPGGVPPVGAERARAGTGAAERVAQAVVG